MALACASSRSGCRSMDRLGPWQGRRPLQGPTGKRKAQHGDRGHARARRILVADPSTPRDAVAQPSPRSPSGYRRLLQRLRPDLSQATATGRITGCYGTRCTGRLSVNSLIFCCSETNSDGKSRCRQHTRDSYAHLGYISQHPVRGCCSLYITLSAEMQIASASTG